MQIPQLASVMTPRRHAQRNCERRHLPVNFSRLVYLANYSTLKFSTKVSTLQPLAAMCKWNSGACKWHNCTIHNLARANSDNVMNERNAKRLARMASAADTIGYSDIYQRFSPRSRLSTYLVYDRIMIPARCGRTTRVISLRR